MVESSEVDILWDNLLDYGIAQEQTLEVATALGGYTVKTLNDVLYVLTGNRTFDQWVDEMSE